MSDSAPGTRIFKAESYVAQPPGQQVSMRCPACLRIGTFEGVGVQDLYLTGPEQQFLGQRRCPNPRCHAHVFVAWEPATNEVVASLPAERLDFDATDLPGPILTSFAEAITCHATGCYVAAAMMVRKTMEQLCLDRKATGGNLKERIASLGKTIVLPKDLLDGMDDLRLLGNDAAHVESQTFDSVGKDELEVAIEFAKEVLKATYQYESLRKRLAALKKPASP